ncbi:MAG: DUF4142 domain-containing protein [Pseudomonadota bacterium]
MNKMKMTGMIAPLLLALLGTANVQAQAPQADSMMQTTLSRGDQRLLEQLAQGNMAEIEAGKLALQQSQNAEVKAFAQQMIDDHGKGLQEVQALAQSKGVSLPSEPDAAHKAMGAKLGALSGDAFDRAYLGQAGVGDHKKTHAFVQKVQANAKDPDLRALAAKLEPTVAMHLTHVEQLNASIRGDTASGASGTEGMTGSGMPSDTAKDKKTRARSTVKPDKASGNTDNPLSPQNPTTQPTK